MKLGLDGRVVLVTGAGQGIGAAVARRFGAEGARVAVGYRSDAVVAADVAREVEEAGGTAIAVRLDITEPESVRAAVELVERELGAVQVLANCAGDFPQPGPFAQLSDDDWRRALRDQLEGPGTVIRAVLPGMTASGWGRIVSVSSVHAAVGNRGVVAHTAAKSGLHGLTRSLARELGPSGILVNAVLPGLTLTDRARARFPEEHVATASAAIPSGHPSTPDGVAALIVFLASAANENVTGELVRAAGGV